MSNKTYYFRFNRIRVDLGEDVFVDAEAPADSFFESPTLEGFASKISEYIAARSGQLIDSEEDGTVNFDTLETTCFGQVFFGDEPVCATDMEKLSSLLK